LRQDALKIELKFFFRTSSIILDVKLGYFTQWLRSIDTEKDIVKRLVRQTGNRRIGESDDRSTGIVIRNFVKA
jgi:hypothetical protein